MAEIDVFKAQLVRPGPDTPWGFRLHRAGNDNQLLITRLTSGSPATNIGLKGGDAVTEIMNKSTRHMGEREAMDCLNSNHTSLILTVERRAGGAPPPPVIQHVQAPQRPQPVNNYTNAAPTNFPVTNNVNSNVGQTHALNYQPYDMTGRSPYQTQGVATPRNYVPPNFEQAQSRPFDKPKNPYASYPAPAPAPAPPQPQAAQEAFSPQGHNDGHARYIPEEDKFLLDLPQSRTFKILTSIMQNPEPSIDKLPAQRSATLERVMAEDRARRRPAVPGAPAAPKPRVKVFMNQQYNNPMGLYHPMNVMESFATQASSLMDDMDRKEKQEEIPASAVQQAIKDEETPSNGITSDL